jgi:drug/metabolite transporter (DMT)-like permease
MTLPLADAPGTNAGKTPPLAQRPKKTGMARIGGGPAAILCATSLMALQDTVIKMMSVDLPLWQLFFIRSVLAMMFMAPLLRSDVRQRLREAIQPWVMVRSILIVLMYICFYAAVPLVELSLVAAIYYTGPIFIVILSSFFLKERITLLSLAVMAVAFSGVIVLLQPVASDHILAALLPLASALCYAFAAVFTQRYTRLTHPWTLTLSLNIVFCISGACGMLLFSLLDTKVDYPFLFNAWSHLSLSDLASLAGLALISLAIHLFLARAYQLGPVPVVASLDYSYLGFAALWSILLLGAQPGWATLTGTLLIGGAGVVSILKGRNSA